MKTLYERLSQESKDSLTSFSKDYSEIGELIFKALNKKNYTVDLTIGEALFICADWHGKVIDLTFLLNLFENDNR